MKSEWQKITKALYTFFVFIGVLALNLLWILPAMWYIWRLLGNG